MTRRAPFAIACGSAAVAVAPALPPVEGAAVPLPLASQSIGGTLSVGGGLALLRGLLRDSSDAG